MALIDNLISYYKLDEVSGDAIDAHGSNDGTVNGCAYSQAGKINTAYNFDADGDFINCGSDGSLDNLTDFSYSVWVYVKGSPENNLGLIICKNLESRHGIMWRRDGDGEHFDVEVDFDNTNAFSQTHDIGDIGVTDTWVHVVVTMSSVDNIIKIYIDGTEEDTYLTQTAGVGSLVDYSGTDLLIGNSAFNNSCFNGTLDEIGIWSRALTQSEITALYNSGNGLAYPFGGATLLMMQANQLGNIGHRLTGGMQI